MTELMVELMVELRFRRYGSGSLAEAAGAHRRPAPEEVSEELDSPPSPASTIRSRFSSVATVPTPVSAAGPGVFVSVGEAGSRQLSEDHHL